MTRQRVTGSSPFALKVGFSRAVRVGDSIWIGGTAPIGDDGESVAPGDPAAQARRCYEVISAALEEIGSSLDDVVRTRTYLTRIEDWEAVAQVRKEFVGHVSPTDTVVQVSGFIRPEWLVEIEVDAVATTQSTGS